MAMALRIKITRYYFLALVLVASLAEAAELDVTPRVEGGVTYTDNVDLTATDEKNM